LRRRAVGSRFEAGDANSVVLMGAGSELAGGWESVPLKLGWRRQNPIAQDLAIINSRRGV
jgi:hypothetical protein